MSRRPARLAPSRTLHTTSTVSRWFGRLAPLAALALFGCLADKPGGSGFDDEASSSGDESGDETAAEVTGDPAGEDPLARLAGECEQRFACDCASDRFTDVAACEEHYKVEWAGVEARAEAAGLSVDFECYVRWLPFEMFACDSYTEFARRTDGQACSFCQYAYGERQVGEACQDFGGGVGDCAQGLLCYPNGQGVAQCIDPCSQAGEIGRAHV